jgi:hypothetical protein
MSCDVFWHWLSREQKDVAVIALYLRQAHMCVLLISKEADSVQDTANLISVAILYYLFLEWKGWVRKHTGVLIIKK